MSSGGSGGGGSSASFDWLSNGLFGRGKANDGSIENCTDVSALCRGIEVDLNLLLTPSSDQTKANDKREEQEGRIERGGETASEASGSTPVEPPHASTLAARLSRIKYLLYNERTSPPPRGPNAVPAVASAVVRCLTREHPDLIPSLLKSMQGLPFEARKDVSSIFNYLLVCGCPDDCAESGGPGDDGGAWRRYHAVMVDFVGYVVNDSKFIEVTTPIVDGHDCTSGPNGVPAAKSSPDVALHCGSMLRSMLRHPSLFRLLVSEKHAPRCIYPFLDAFVHQPNFEVASDALETVRVIFTGGGGAMNGPNTAPVAEGEESMEEMSSAFLQRDYDAVIDERFSQKMLSGSASYVTKRASVQLLSTILLTRSNYAVMMRYISSRANLRTIMCLLRDPSPHITFLSFQVFKIFVANPEKPKEVIRILVDNKSKLVRYLDGLHRDREECDEQFRDEKALVIATLEGLEL